MEEAVQAKKQAVENLKQLLPHLEAQGEDARRCFSVIIENFHMSSRRLAAMERTGVIDDAVHDFLSAARDIGENLERLVTVARHIETATNEMVKGARDLSQQGKIG